MVNVGLGWMGLDVKEKRKKRWCRLAGRFRRGGGRGVRELVTYQMFVSGPGAHGPDVPFGPHVLEAGVFQPAFEVRARTGLHAAFVGGGEVDSVEDFGGVFFREGVVRGAPFEVEVDALDPAAWYGVPDGGYQLALNTGGGGNGPRIARPVMGLVVVGVVFSVGWI